MEHERSADMALEPPGGGSSRLIVRRDGRIVTVERSVAALLGVPDAESLADREWVALLAADSIPAFAEARVALSSGLAWSGLLVHRYGTGTEPAGRTVTLATSIQPTAASAEFVVVSVTAVMPSLQITPRTALARGATTAADSVMVPSQLDRSSEQAIVAAQLEVHETMRELHDPSAAARATLQALATALPFEWGAVLRFEGSSATVVAVYPSPMAGVGSGRTWVPDDAETAVREHGEPIIEGDLSTIARRGASPLRRLPGFGLRSRVLVPLYGATDVVGLVVLYRSGELMFDGAAGLTVERATRPMGELLTRTAGISPGATSHPSEVSPGLETVAAEIAAYRSEESQRSTATDVDFAPLRSEEAVQVPLSRLDSLGELVAGVAHELNNPLTAILGYTQILGALEDDERERALQTIESEAQRAARIVRNLLAFARQRPGERRLTDVEAVLRRVIDLRRYSLEVDDVRVITRFGHVPEVLIDEGQFEQVFLNLLSNAHQALKGRGGEVVITTRTEGDRLLISFADDGPGVPESMRARVFEPFFTTREVGAGQGMGLSIVYGVVTNHGGRTWVEESTGGGAEFVVELPVEITASDVDADLAEAIAQARAAEREAGLAHESGHHVPTGTMDDGDSSSTDGGPVPESATKQRILVVDDEAPVRALTQEILHSRGFEVDTVESGQQALRRLERDEYAMVITDLRMPQMGGADLYHQIGSRWPHLTDRVLFVTGDIEGDRGGAALDVARIHYLEKPFTITQLVGAIRRVLDQ